MQKTLQNEKLKSFSLKLIFYKSRIYRVKERALARVAFGGEGVDNFGVSSVPKKVEKDNFCAPNLTASFVLTIFQIYS